MSSLIDNLTNIISATPTAIAVVDTKMCYIAASQKWVDDYGLHGKKILGRSHYELFPEIGEEWKAIHADCLRGNAHKN
ncbi:PAS domain-containing protein [Daejeonella sp.]|uniref:PAS domain-containing protein n=1 Tax=Daejeonella sp. TaxID=2805397 RepID=UPI0027217250|nr:PAS domain-containing protein [Daejeonella sp.]MDO8993988.1 PAS domain-containing protein [Daejeonella sp.]MDP2414437.1 PAS domain-containing protein [Daejeonella sp.]